MMQEQAASAGMKYVLRWSIPAVLERQKPFWNRWGITAVYPAGNSQSAQQIGQFRSVGVVIVWAGGMRMCCGPMSLHFLHPVLGIRLE